MKFDLKDPAERRAFKRILLQAFEQLLMNEGSRERIEKAFRMKKTELDQIKADLVDEKSREKRHTDHEKRSRELERNNDRRAA